MTRRTLAVLFFCWALAAPTAAGPAPWRELRLAQAIIQAKAALVAVQLEGLEDRLWQARQAVQAADVIVTTFNATRRQCDADPEVTASMRPSRPGHTLAVSRTLRKRLGLRWGTLAIVPGHGLWVVEDLMGPSIIDDRVDLMLPRGRKHFRQEARVFFLR